MKRITLFALVVLLLAFSLAIVAWLRSPDPNAPQFKRIQASPRVQQISYEFLDTRPFEGGKMWIYGWTRGTNGVALLYDIEKRQVIGQLTNGWPVTLFGDPPRLLCGESVSARTGPKEFLARLLGQISGGRFNFPQTEVIRYWLLNPETHTASRLGDLHGTPNFSFSLSPDYRYADTGRHNNSGGVDSFCFDLERGFIKKLHVPGWAAGWWDNTHVLVQTTNVDFTLYDVSAETTTPLIATAQIAALLREHGISEDPKKAGAFFNWNGRENDFYLTDAHQKWLAAKSFLIKVERPNGRLKLLSPSFKFEWSDHFDPTGRYYLYSGREAGDASDGVFVRDLQSGTTNVLVSANSNKSFSIPMFYGDSVIYIRSNVLWRINLDGSNNIRLFPPPDTVEDPAK